MTHSMETDSFAMKGQKNSQARNHGELLSEAMQIQKKQIYGVINLSVFEVAIACRRCEDWNMRGFVLVIQLWASFSLYARAQQQKKPECTLFSSLGGEDFHLSR